MHDWVRAKSPIWINQRVDRETLEILDCYRQAAPGEIAVRLRELEDEYDVESASELLAHSAAIAAVLLAPRRPGMAKAIAGALGIRLLTGWRPLLPLVRLFGFRSRREIDRELHALKALRGDHKRVQLDPTAKGALTTAQGEVGVEAKIAGNGPALPRPVRTPVHGIEQYPIRVT